jgi:hypothetical protein
MLQVQKIPKKGRMMSSIRTHSDLDYFAISRDAERLRAEYVGGLFARLGRWIAARLAPARIGRTA